MTNAHQFQGVKPAPRVWLERFYRNSAAHAERRVLHHSVHHRSDLRTVRRMWGSAPVPQFFPVRSPGEHTEQVELKLFRARDKGPGPRP